MRESQVFLTIDLTSGFWQQSLEKSSRSYTAFTVPWKRTQYLWTVTPMGLQGSFAQLIDYCMRKICGVLTYIPRWCFGSLSGPIPTGGNFGDSISQVEEVWSQAQCGQAFGAREVTYLGYRLKGDEISLGR